MKGGPVTKSTGRRQARPFWYKRPFDLTILVLAHVLLLPLWLPLWTCIPLLVWLEDGGPGFYRQRRAGRDGWVFTILKFRTMAPDGDVNGPTWTTRDDPRVTRAGKFLRRTALDELREVLSILKGDMSLVRPKVLYIKEQEWLEQQIPGFEQRLLVLPGLTGLAQVYVRTDNAPDKFRYDLAYLERMGPWLDVKLLILSALNTIMGRWDHRSGKLTMAAESYRTECRPDVTVEYSRPTDVVDK
ncbi:MAG: sugar transferase [Chloroflexi bacterium]|nr:sugar transferase [Chloroflexota bacterium]